MSQKATATHSDSHPWRYAALTLITIGVVAALAHQSEDRRLREVEQVAALELKANLDKALDFAFALQSASVREPAVSSGGDTIAFALPTGYGRTEELMLFVDATQGGLCLVRAGRPAELVALSVDAFRATLDRRSDGRPVLCVELSACQSKSGEPPLRQHMYRSIVLEERLAESGHG